MNPDGFPRNPSLPQPLQAATTGGGSVGERLESLGGLLRRGRQPGAQSVEQALRGLSRNEVEGWLATFRPELVETALRRATEEAAESALGEEEGEEAEVWRASAMEGLLARDRAESAVRAVEALEKHHGPLEGEAGRALKVLRESLERLDHALRPSARWLIALNSKRRAEQQSLQAAERERAWWYSARVECDDFLVALSESPRPETPHLQSCKECRADLERVALVEEPPRRHLGADELWRYEMGELSTEERAWVEAHTRKCTECAQAVLALEEGESAIEEALELEEEELPQAARGSRAPEVSRRPAARHPEQREVLEERREFRAVLVRERQRVRLVVQPLAGKSVMAAVFLTPGRPSLKPQPGPEGIAFELGVGGGRSAHLTVKVGSETFERDFTF